VAQAVVGLMVVKAHIVPVDLHTLLGRMDISLLGRFSMVMGLLLFLKT
jgi:hypothetical protein